MGNTFVSINYWETFGSLLLFGPTSFTAANFICPLVGAERWGNYSWKRAWQECGHWTKTVNLRKNFPLKENQKVPNPSSSCYKSDRPWLYHGRCATFHCAASAHRRRAAASLHPNARWRCCQHDREMFYARNICGVRPVGVVWYYMNCTAVSLPSAAFVTCPAFAMAKDPFPRGFFRKLLYIQVSFREISLHSESNRQSGLASLYYPMLRWVMRLSVADTYQSLDLHVVVRLVEIFRDRCFFALNYKVKHPLDTRCCSNHIHDTSSTCSHPKLYLRQKKFISKLHFWVIISIFSFFVAFCRCYTLSSHTHSV